MRIHFFIYGATFESEFLKIKGMVAKNRKSSYANLCSSYVFIAFNDILDII